MAFRDLVATEASTLLDHVVASHSQQSLQQLAVFREALGEALLRLESALADSAEDRHFAEMSALVKRLVANAQTAQSQAEAERQETRERLVAASETEAALRVRLAGADAEIGQARAEAESLARTTADVERALTSAKVTIAELTSQRSTGGGAPASGLGSTFGRLIAIYQDIDNGHSVAAVLTALAKGLGDRFSRVSLFSVNGNALQGMYQLGFDIDKDITKIIVPLALESVLSRAVTSGVVQTLSPGDSPDRSQLPFGGASGWCMALPVPVNGEIVAVIYGDDGDHADPDESTQASWVAFADVARRYAMSVLAKLTIDLKALDELRNYATLLLDEVEYMYGADASSGKQNIELVEQLTENLRCAQETYIRRLASAPVSDAGASLFESRLNRLIDTKGATSFGRHLSIAAAAIAKVDPAVAQTRSPRVAQAS